MLYNSKILFKCINILLYFISNKNFHVFYQFSKLSKQNDRKLVEPPPPVIFIAGRPKAALLFWFLGDFRCGALLFMVTHVIYKYENR